MIKRRRGAVIVKTKKGILVVSKKDKIFTLPGGGAKRYESRKKAAIRELYEETGLKAEDISLLFCHIGNKWKEKLVKNYTHVFLVKAKGNPKTKNEVKHISFWKSSSKLTLTDGARKSIERYLKESKKQ